MIKKPKRFKAYELVDKKTYGRFGEGALMFFRPELIKVLDEIGEAWPKNSIIVNNWRSGGPWQWRGLRTVDFVGGAHWSAHRVGAGVDFNVSGLSSDAVFKFITENPEKFPSIRRIEDPKIAKTWTHVDVFEHNNPGILVVGA